MNSPFIFCQYCGAKNFIESQQMKAKIRFENIDISGNTEIDNIIESAEFAIQSNDYGKANDLIMAAILSGKKDYKIYICKIHLDLWTEKDKNLFSDLEMLQKIEKTDDSPELKEALKELMLYKGKNGITCLHNATFHERYDMVVFCVEHGADVNSRAGMNDLSPISIMYYPLQEGAQNLNGTPFVRDMDNVKRIRDYLVEHGAFDDYKATKNKKAALSALSVIGVIIVFVIFIALIASGNSYGVLPVIPSLVCPIICAVVAKQKGRSAIAWFIVGFLGIIGLVIAIIIPKKEK